MKFLLVPFCICLAAAAVSAQPASQIITTRSYSGQFMAREMRERPRWAASPVATRVPIAGSLAFLVAAPPAFSAAQADSLRLEAETAGVSCERIKQLLLLLLGMTDDWKGRIELIISPALPEERGPLLTAICQRDGWSYELELPKTIQPRIFVAAVVQTLLTELANRGAGSQSADIPFWLVEGIGAHLQAYNVPTFIIRPNVQSTGYRDARIEGSEGIRAALRERAPLTFQQLSWPAPSNVEGKEEMVYRSCAQLLLESLLHLDDGQACLRRMLQDMPNHLNWQTAFLKAFHSHFERLLDVEKWWGLNCVSFVSSDLTGPWTEQECWHKFQDALDVPVEVQIDPAHKPAEARLTLQEAIMQWSAPDALAAVQRAVRELEGLQFCAFRGDVNLDASAASSALQQNARNMEAAQWSLGRELNPLVARYVTILLSYAKQSQENPVFASGRKLAVSPHVLLKRETVRQLDELDKELAALRAKSPSATRAAELSALEALEEREAKSARTPGN